jgi:hypothetical protein
LFGCKVNVHNFVLGIKNADETNFYLETVKDLADIYACDADDELWILSKDWFINVAGVALLYHKMETFDIVVKRIPTLMFRTSITLENGEQIFSKTPLDIAAVRFQSPHFVGTILSHEVLAKYATQSPDWYNQMVAFTLNLAQSQFTHPMSDNQVRVIRLLEGAVIQK